MSSNSNNSGSPPKPPGPNATKEETLKYLLRPVGLHKTRGLNFQQFKAMQLKTEKAMLAAGNTPAIKEAPSQDGKAIQDNQEDTEHLSSSSK